MTHTTKLFLFAALALLPLQMTGEVLLPQVFADGMVLQREASVRLWGWCDQFYGGTPGKKVTVTTSWNGKRYSATSDADGRFEVTVPTPQAGGPYEVTFSDGTRHRLTNIYIGEVWLCSGQSNMEMLMKGYKGQPVEGAAEELLQCGDSLLRLFYAKQNATLQPQHDVKGGPWRAANAESVREFSATAYFFGRELQRRLKVPVGIVASYYGGTFIECWMSRQALDATKLIPNRATASCP